jgi:transcriptional regulator with XRE-family HTH domain
MQVVSDSRVYDAPMTEQPRPSHGKRLRTLREAVGITQREMASLLDVHHSNVGFWERTGTVPRSTLLPKMAEILGVPVEELLGQPAKARRKVAPPGRAKLAFDAVARLPRKQQEKILEMVEAFVSHTAKAA